MGDSQTDPGLAELVDAHRRATVRIIHLNDRSTCGSCTVPDVALAFQNEISARNRLLSWHAPSARLAMDKLCHLLSHVMAGNLEFDDESLACIRQEVARFRTSPSADHAKEGFSHLKQQYPTLIQKGVGDIGLQRIYKTPFPRLTIFVVTYCCYAALIYDDSMMTQKIARTAAWSCLAFIIFVTVSPIGLRPHDVLPVDADRALAFALMAMLFVIAYPRQILLCGLLVVLGAGAIELLQLLSPTRHAHFDDAAIKAAGAFFGVFLGWAFHYVRSFRRA